MGVELHLRLILHVAVQFAALHLGVSHLPLLHLIEQVGVRDLRILVPMFAPFVTAPIDDALRRR